MLLESGENSSIDVFRTGIGELTGIPILEAGRSDA